MPSAVPAQQLFRWKQNKHDSVQPEHPQARQNGNFRNASSPTSSLSSLKSKYRSHSKTFQILTSNYDLMSVKFVKCINIFTISGNQCHKKIKSHSILVHLIIICGLLHQMPFINKKTIPIDWIEYLSDSKLDEII